MKINVYRDSEPLGTFDSVEEAAYTLRINPRSIQRNLRGETEKTKEGYSFKDDLIVVSGFSYPYYITSSGERIHKDDTYFDENNNLRRK